jgi:Cu/Ag efflux protein CusF
MDSCLSVSEFERHHASKLVPVQLRPSMKELVLTALITLIMSPVGIAFLALITTFSLSSGNAWAQDVFSYSVKGVVKALPGNGRASNEIIVKHEAIPDYRDESGNIVGMMAMTMPFYLAKTTKIDGIAVGDAVQMTVEQRLKPGFTEEVVSITKSAK